jgi:hypothetical protein
LNVKHNIKNRSESGSTRAQKARKRYLSFIRLFFSQDYTDENGLTFLGDTKVLAFFGVTTLMQINF